MKSVLRAMDFSIEKLYSYGRYKILDKEILRSIEQYFPARGEVLDIGCGFGLFSSYFALGNDQLTFWGFDKNRKRIKFARQLAKNLELINASFDVQNAVEISIDQKYACIYMLDIIHHLPKEFVPKFIQGLVENLEEGGRLIIKDVDTFPYPKMVFTWLLDKIMSPQDTVHYWPSNEFIELLESNGLTVFRHSINDILPYSHVLYICHKQ
jgi:2-polyprenyl-3-methyl-5-hydroxy-6-metoxy-1,4-benzoquinol methylase